MFLSCVRGWITLFLLFPLFVGAQASSQFNTQVRFGENIDPPTVPTDIVASPISPFQIDLTWSASTDLFGVAGYQIFRDNVQVATTSLTEFSDTGLAASTTYGYSIRAFDTDGLISSSSSLVSTTTFDLPPLPPVEPEATTTQTSGSLITVMPQYFNLEAGSEVARFEFGVNTPVAYRIQYGVNDTLSTGVVQTQVLRRDHATVVTDLSSNTTYVFELYVTDRFGREVLLRRGTFTTEPQFMITMPSNVESFSAQVIASDVLLRWSPNPQEPYAYVRLVRNSRFFPTDPFDGTVVYQGVDLAFTDVGAMDEEERQYYTLFAYDLSGTPSSGAVAIAARLAVPPSQPLPPVPPPQIGDGTDTEVVTPEPSIYFTLSDIELIQNDRNQRLSDSVMIEKDTAFVVRVPSELVPTQTRVVMVTLWKPEDNWTTSYLLQLDETDGYYKAVLPGLLRVGTYDIRIELYDGKQDRFFYVNGLVGVEDVAVSEEQDQGMSFSLFALYILLGGLAGIIIALGLYRLLWFWFVARRYQDEDRF